MPLEQDLRRWADEELNELNGLLNTLHERLYCSYEPSLPPRPGFWRRLDKWLDNLGAHEDDAKKTLLRLAANLFYIGPSEFLELYRYAYNGPIARWLIEEEKIDITDVGASMKLQEAVGQTWFCPISDSMRINSFYHVNDIPVGADYRPDWRSMAIFGSTDALQKYCKQNRLKRLVLLEDFVGGGSQMSKAIEYAAKFAPYLRVLVIPLVICPKGNAAAQSLQSRYASVRFDPIVTIPQAAFLSLGPMLGERSLHTALRKLALDTYSKVTDGKAVGPMPYHPLGFPSTDPTGGLIVMYSNTPDNTLPLIHHLSATWDPLFPRHSRV